MRVVLSTSIQTRSLSSARALLWTLCLWTLSCSSILDVVDERNTADDDVSPPQHITGSYLTFESARVRCSFTQLEETTYQTQCDLVTVGEDGQEFKVKSLSDGIQVAWQPYKVLKGRITKGSCQQKSQGVSQSCLLDVDSKSAEIDFRARITDTKNVRQKIESDQVMLPFSVEVAAGFIPFVPFHVKIDQSQEPQNFGDATLHGRQAVSFPHWNPGMGLIEHVCAAGDKIYIAAKHNFVNVIYSKRINDINSQIEFFAGAPNGEKDIAAKIDRFRVQFSDIRSLECNANEIYVASDGRLMKVPTHGLVTTVAEVPVSGMSLTEEALFYTSSEMGSVYEYNLKTQKNRIIDPRSKIQIDQQDSDLTRPEAVTVGLDNNLYVVYEQRKTIEKVGGVIGNTGFQVIRYDIAQLNPQTGDLKHMNSIDVEAKKLTTNLIPFQIINDAPGHFYYVVNGELGEFGDKEKAVALTYDKSILSLRWQQDQKTFYVSPNSNQAQDLVVAIKDQKVHTLVTSRAQNTQFQSVKAADVLFTQAPVTTLDSKGRAYLCHNQNLYTIGQDSVMKLLASNCYRFLVADTNSHKIYYYNNVQNAVRELTLDDDGSFRDEVYIDLTGHFVRNHKKMLINSQGELFFVQDSAPSLLHVDHDKVVHALTIQTEKPYETVDSMAISPDDRIFLGLDGDIYELSLATLQATEVKVYPTKNSRSWFLSDMSFDHEGNLFVTTLENASNAGKMLRVDLNTQNSELIYEEFLDMSMRQDCVTGKIGSESLESNVDSDLKASIAKMCGGHSRNLSILGCQEGRRKYTMLYTQYMFGFHNVVRIEKTCAERG